MGHAFEKAAGITQNDVEPDKKRFFLQSQRLIKLYNDEIKLGKNIFWHRRDKLLLTPMYPLLGFPNYNMDGYEKFMKQKINPIKHSLTKKFITLKSIDNFIPVKQIIDKQSK